MGKPSKSKARAKARQKKNKTVVAQPAPSQLMKTAVWQPGIDPVDEGDALDYDPTAYDCLVAFSIDWPCLSFDILHDNVGDKRQTFPHSMYLMAGTQAATQQENCTALLKLTGIAQGRHGDKSKAAAGEDADNSNAEDSDDDSSEDDDEDEDDTGREKKEEKECLFSRRAPHFGSVNRIRAMPQQPSVIATWGDSSIVQVWDMTKQLDELIPLSGAAVSAAEAHAVPAPLAPRHMHRHADEGYALDWSPACRGRLASGDCAAVIQVAEVTDSGRWSMGPPYLGHTGSVEDIQWSPTEATVFASCSCDRSIRIWDTRERSKAMLSVPNAHGGDVNVISWRAVVSHMLASGGDEGVLKVWDLRAFAEGKHLANFAHHRGAITSVEWSPFEGAMLATGSADGTVGIWDLSVERDPEEEQALGSNGNAAAPKDLPPQLLFIHAGQTDIKEVHWHPQIPGMLVSTAREGFNAFKPANI